MTLAGPAPHCIFACMQATVRPCSLSQKPSRIAATPSGAHSQFCTGWVARHSNMLKNCHVHGVAEPIARQLGMH
jgi:hypothetical protein